jgi:uncharacterized protein YjbJ (UPF0337 family)
MTVAARVSLEREIMNVEQLKGNWQIFKGKVKEQWGKLTDDDLNVAEGKVDQIAGKVAVKYGIAKEEAQQKLQSLCNECSNKM